jgi:hypothetical protein
MNLFILTPRTAFADSRVLARIFAAPAAVIAADTAQKLTPAIPAQTVFHLGD